jgi:hypothetical protein
MTVPPNGEQYVIIISKLRHHFFWFTTHPIHKTPRSPCNVIAMRPSDRPKACPISVAPRLYDRGRRNDG